MYILVTGGLGYIGSHICYQLLQNNYKVICVDNFDNCDNKVFEVLHKITNKENFIFYRGDYGDKILLYTIFGKFKIKNVIHLAGHKSIPESVNLPLKYYNNNVSKTINLLDVMNDKGCKNIIFSSSASVYGQQEYPVSEISSTGNNLISPYSKSKYFIENILEDLYKSDNKWKIFILRYFNPLGCEPNGLLGQNFDKQNTSIFSSILRVLCSKSDKLTICGNDYDTNDGTCIRDYIHVSDLADAHISCLKVNTVNEIKIYNIGTGIGVSVKELIDIFSKVNQIKIPHEIGNRRPGDLPIIFCDCSKAMKELNWSPKKNIEDMCRDAWNYIVVNNLINID